MFSSKICFNNGNNIKRRAIIQKEMEKFEVKTGRRLAIEEMHIITRNSKNKKFAKITGNEVRKYQLEQLELYSKFFLMDLRNNAFKSHENLTKNK